MDNVSKVKALFQRPGIIIYKGWREVDSIIVERTLKGKRI